MARISVWLLVAFVLTACGSGSKAALGAFAEACTPTMACAKGLTCTNGLCTGACQTDLQCQGFKSGAVCVYNICYEPCHDKGNCSNNLDCVLVNMPNTMGICKILLQSQH
jgi:hypothetical protein